MNLNKKFNKIFSMLINDKNKKNKLLKLLNTFYEQNKNEEITLCLIKMLIINIYTDSNNFDLSYNIINFIVFRLDKKIKIKLLKIISNFNLSKQFYLSDKLIKQISLNTTLFLKKPSNDKFNIIYNLLHELKKINLKYIENKCIIYNFCITDLIKSNNISKKNSNNIFKNIVLNINKFILN